MNTISIARNFSTTPGGRTDEDGPNNGRRFRDKFLIPAVEKKSPLCIDLDGVAGLPGSFCDEAFGAIIRIYKMRRAEFDSLFRFVGKDEDYSVNKGMIDINVDRAISKLDE